MSTPSDQPHVAHGVGPPSPLACKRQRFTLSSDALPVIPFVPAPDTDISLAPFRFEPCSNMDVDCPELNESHLSPVMDTLPIADPLQYAFEKLREDAHSVYIKISSEEQNDKETRRSYGRHVEAYTKWWNENQLIVTTKDPARQVIPALPITVDKVVLFLNYETSRPKRKCGSQQPMVGTSVGLSQIKQVISALEYERFHNQRMYRNDSAAQRPLRTDPQIHLFESATAHNEPKRIEKSQALKAAGTSADTYAVEQLIRASTWCLTDFRGPRQIFVSVRDRAMLLLSTSIAFRGDSSHSLLWSDLFFLDVPVHDIELGATVRALVILADNAKHNQTGRTDEFGMFRHRLIELCLVGAIALLFFTLFHIQGIDVPSFIPDFSDVSFGEYGKREWYGLLAFSTRTPLHAMTYENHRERVNLIHLRNDISVSKVTHAGRPYTAKTSRENGATVNGVKALGGWSESGSYRDCYDRALPVDALLGAAMFNGKKPESYVLPRDRLQPPPELLAQVFPWVEGELDALRLREQSSRYAQDVALHNFLRLLLWLRVVLLQDAALLFSKYPSCGIFNYPPFNSPSFREFAVSSTARIQEVEAEARLAFQKLPNHLVLGLRGALTNISLDQKREKDEHKVRLDEMQQQLVQMSGMMEHLAGSRSSRRKASTLTLPPPVPSAPDPGLSFSTPAAHSFPIAVLPHPLAILPSDIHATSPSTPAAPTFSMHDVPSSVSCSAALLDRHQPSSAPFADIINQCTPLSAPTSSILPGPLDEQSAMPPAGDPITDPQTAAWKCLASRFGDERLRKHNWDWIAGTQTWLPHYRFQPTPKIIDVWAEYSEGLNGFLSVRELNTGWGAKWRRNNGGQKTEAARRKKVVDLIDALSSRPWWDVNLALRFICEGYEGKYTPRAFCDYIQRNGGIGLEEVLSAAQSYP